MASTTANPLWDIWRRRTYSRPDFTGIDWAGYTPQMNTPMADPGLVAGNARVASGTTIPQTSGVAGSSFLKRVFDKFAELEQPEPADGLSAQNLGVRSPWSITNKPWEALSPVPPHILKKKRGPQ